MSPVRRFPSTAAPPQATTSKPPDDRELSGREFFAPDSAALVDRIEPGAELDFVDALAAPMPMTVLA
jgi:hypothetical protein